MDTYKCFAELKASELLDTDYAVVATPRNGTRVAVIAPHGGGIEPRTAEIAQVIAGGQFSVYCFKGLKKKGNKTLHITSPNFDEPKCLKLIGTHTWVLAIHGFDSEGQRVLLGGLDAALVRDLARGLSTVGITAETSGHKYTGTCLTNICNRGATGKGAQFELSMAFRKSQRVSKFVAAVRE